VVCVSENVFDNGKSVSGECIEYGEKETEVSRNEYDALSVRPSHFCGTCPVQHKFFWQNYTNNEGDC
jgi:hypothetical protein